MEDEIDTAVALMRRLAKEHNEARAKLAAAESHIEVLKTSYWARDVKIVPELEAKLAAAEARVAELEALKLNIEAAHAVPQVVMDWAETIEAGKTLPAEGIRINMPRDECEAVSDWIIAKHAKGAQ